MSTAIDRFLSRDGCAALVKRARELATGGGSTTLFVQDSSWTANLRWARNEVMTSGDVRGNRIRVLRTVRGAAGDAVTSATDDEHLALAVCRAERYLQFAAEDPQSDIRQLFVEEYLKPKIWSDATYTQTAQERAELARTLMEPSIKAGVLSAGYMQVAAHGWSSMDEARVWYYPFTVAQYSVTVRDPKLQGSGWAGADHNDWTKIDVRAISEIALEKCLRSRNPVRLEPGRYTTILEPQAVADLCGNTLTDTLVWDRELAEYGDPTALKESEAYRQYGLGDPRLPKSPFGKGGGYSKLGERVIDERLSLTTDPMDPELGYPPFQGWTVYHPTTWITDGVLRTLAYNRKYAVQKLGENSSGVSIPGAPMPGSFRLRGAGTLTPVEEMIATTKRGLIVTRFWAVQAVDFMSQLQAGYTRDGLWLVENGTVTKAVKNFRFTESPLFILNNVEQIGVPKRVLSPTGGVFPMAVPALKVRDFSFTSLSDAV